jgi:hypothetical protein
VSKGKRGLGKGIGCALFVVAIAVVTLYAGIFQSEEMNQLFNWLSRLGH